MIRRAHSSRRRAIGSALVAVGVALAPVVWPTTAYAQSTAELAKARQLYRQGLTQEAAGDWTGALETFQRVARIKVTPQVRFHIARSKEHLGRLNEALGGYRLAEYEAKQAGDKASGVLDQIQAARRALEKRIPKLVIKRGAGAEAIKIELDGVVVGPSQIGHPVNVDPGPHQLVGELSGGRSFKKTVTVKEGQTQDVVLDVPKALRDKHAAAASKPTAAPSPAPAPTSAPAPSGAETPPEPTQDHAAHVSSGSSVAPWIIGGVGVASLAASGVFYALRNSAKKKLDDGCLGDKCPVTLQSTQDAGQRYATLTGVALGVGVAGIGVAAVWLLTGKSSSKSDGDTAGRSVNVRVAAAPHSTGVSIGGHF